MSSSVPQFPLLVSLSLTLSISLSLSLCLFFFSSSLHASSPPTLNIEKKDKKIHDYALSTSLSPPRLEKTWEIEKEIDTERERAMFSSFYPQEVIGVEREIEIKTEIEKKKDEGEDEDEDESYGDNNKKKKNKKEKNNNNNNNKPFVVASIHKGERQEFPVHRQRQLAEMFGGKFEEEYDRRTRRNLIERKKSERKNEIDIESEREGERRNKSRKGTVRRTEEKEEEEDLVYSAPVMTGYGTHFAFLYVGQPQPQRVSVILDTGSHWTAFPCSGCNKCGNSHTDPEFDVGKSTTLYTLNCQECPANAGTCRDDKCSIQLSYAEGSSWRAYSVRDEVYIGGTSLSYEIEAVKAKTAGETQAEVSNGENRKGVEREDGDGEGPRTKVSTVTSTTPVPLPVHSLADLSVPFVFGCQTYETGLFRTQLENGIMGLSDSPLTLISRLHAVGKISNHIFSMCFTSTGGTLALGGYEEHRNLGQAISWVPMKQRTGWITVQLNDIQINGETLGEDYISKYNSNHGTIVDSGTTDTYLPQAVGRKFMQIFQRQSGGISWSNNKFSLSKETMDNLPIISFSLENEVVMTMGPSSYLECDSREGLKNSAPYRCMGTIFLDNRDGVVLGANFMQQKQIVFDKSHHRVGFAEANCEYSFNEEDNQEEDQEEEEGVELEEENEKEEEEEELITTQEKEKEEDEEINQNDDEDSNAKTDNADKENNSSTSATSEEENTETTNSNDNNYYNNYQEQLWSSCSSSCSQSRYTSSSPPTVRATVEDKTLENRFCSYGDCPYEESSYKVSFVMILSSPSVSAGEWTTGQKSRLIRQTLEESLAKTLGLDAGNVILSEVMGTREEDMKKEEETALSLYVVNNSNNNNSNNSNNSKNKNEKPNKHSLFTFRVQFPPLKDSNVNQVIYEDNINIDRTRSRDRRQMASFDRQPKVMERYREAAEQMKTSLSTFPFAKSFHESMTEDLPSPFNSIIRVLIVSSSLVSPSSSSTTTTTKTNTDSNNSNNKNNEGEVPNGLKFSIFSWNLVGISLGVLFLLGLFTQLRRNNSGAHTPTNTGGMNFNLSSISGMTRRTGSHGSHKASDDPSKLIDHYNDEEDGEMDGIMHASGSGHVKKSNDDEDVLSPSRRSNGRGKGKTGKEHQQRKDSIDDDSASLLESYNVNTMPVYSNYKVKTTTKAGASYASIPTNHTASSSSSSLTTDEKGKVKAKGRNGNNNKNKETSSRFVIADLDEEDDDIEMV